MILVAFSYIILTLAMVGFGAPLYRMLRSASPAVVEPTGLFLMLLLGLAIVGSLANICNFFFPISPLVAGLFLALGIALFVVLRKFIWTVVSAAWPWAPLGLLAIMVGLFVGTAWAVAKETAYYDAGLYYYQAVKWIQESRVPFGLANLHGRFGFNSLWFSVVAAWGAPGLQDHVLVAANGMVFAVYGVCIGMAAARTWAAHLRLSSIFLIGSAIPWFMLVKNGVWLSSATPDALVVFLGCLVVYLLLRSLEEEEGASFYIAMTTLVAVFATAVKLSSLPFLLAPILLICRQQLRRRRRPGSFAMLPQPLAARVVGLAALVWVPWTIRGVILSGCLAYPSTLGCFQSLPWAVPLGAVRDEAQWITSWARQPGVSKELVLGNWHWFRPWLNLFLADGTVRAMIGVMLIGVLLLLAAVIRHRSLRQLDILLIAAVAPLAGMVFWFIQAPSVRFSQPFFWPLSLLALAGGISELFLDPSNVQVRSDPIIVWHLFVLLLAVTWPIPRDLWLSPIKQGPLVWPSRFPVVDAKENRTPDGVTIWSPASGDQCWDILRPCTPYFNASMSVTLDSQGQPRMFRSAGR